MSTNGTLRWPASAVSRHLLDQIVKSSLELRWRVPGSIGFLSVGIVAGRVLRKARRGVVQASPRLICKSSCR